MRHSLRHLTGLLAAVAWLSPAQAAPPVATAAETYAELPLGEGAHLSPDGTRIAVVAEINGQPTLVVWRIGTHDANFLPLGQFTADWLAWKSDRRLILGLRLIIHANPYHPVAETRLVAVDADGSNVMDLAPIRGNGRFIDISRDHLVSRLAGDPAHVLLELVTDKPQEQRYTPDVLRIDVGDASADRVQGERFPVNSWMADPKGVIRLGIGNDGELRQVFVRNDSGASWRLLHSARYNVDPPFEPVAFSADDPNILYVLSDHELGRNAIYEFDIARKQFGNRVAESPDGDIEPIVRGDRLVGFKQALQPAKETYLDPGWQADLTKIDAALPGGENIIVDRSADDSVAFVRSVKSNAPALYWIVYLNAAPARAVLVAHSYRLFDAAKVAPVKEVTYPARDGLPIRALLTLPAGYKSGAIPFIVLPHGGPSAHDAVEFDYWVQFIANLGYGVLQPQFRGSTGFGTAFERAGFKQWGLAMQDDVTDGTKWLVDQKLADPARICIMGGSYGGYAALAGAIKEPGLYRCAAAVAPVTDLQRYVGRLRHSVFAGIDLPQVDTGENTLIEASPLDQAAKIHIPVLLIHGRDDYTVPLSESENMERALREDGKSVEADYLGGADHYLTRSADRLAVLKAIGQFLEDNLGPGAG